MRIMHTALMWLVVIVVSVGGGSMQAESFSGTGIVLISPATKQVQLNETFDLYIAIDAQVKYFKTFEYDIEVDTNVIKLIAAAPEPFFPASFFTWKHTVKTFPPIGSRYVYEIVGSIFGYEIYVDGPGQVVKMTFKAVGNGVSDVTFRYIYMTDWHDITMSMQDSLSGLVRVGATSYLCGDANGDGDVDISDAVYLISYIFSGGAAPIPLLAGDANCDHMVDISDVVYLISYIFSGGQPPCYSCP
jgi:hypothetical protein